MTIQNYLMVQNDVVTNVVVWNGDVKTWQPPADATMLVESTTPAMIWMIPIDGTSYVLTEVIGEGAIGYTWDGSVLTTDEPKPEDPPVVPTQPT